MFRSLAVVLLLAAPVAADVQLDVPSVTRGSDRVVVARVVNVRAQFTRNRFGDEIIESHAVLDVLETLKGSPQAVAHVTVEGGTVGDLTLTVSNLPLLHDGDRAVFFLRGSRGGTVLVLDASDQTNGRSLNAIRAQVRGAK